MKYLPNLLTTIRLILAFALLFVEPLSPRFFILYVICGVSDVLDGYIARKTRNVSKVGALIDSIADFFLILILMILLLPIFHIPIWIGLWILGIAIIRFSSLLVGFLKYHNLAFLHTYTNKITGILLFCSPLIIVMIGLDLTGAILCAIASISAFEELLINIKSKELIRDVKSIF